MALAVNREHTAKAIIGRPKALPVGYNEGSGGILFIEVAAIDNGCCVLFLHPLAHRQWLRGLVGYAQCDMAKVKAHDGDGIFIIARAFPILVAHFHSRSATVPGVQLRRALAGGPVDGGCIGGARCAGCAVAGGRWNYVAGNKGAEEEAEQKAVFYRIFYWHIWHIRFPNPGFHRVRAAGRRDASLRSA